MMQVMGMVPAAASNKLLSLLRPAPVHRLFKNGPSIICPNTIAPGYLGHSCLPNRTQAPWGRNPECAVFSTGWHKAKAPNMLVKPTF